MSLKDVIEETKKQIEEVVKTEEAAVEEEVKDDVKEEPKEEPKEAEDKPEEKPVEEPKKTPAQYAKERRENSKMKAELDAANKLAADLAAKLVTKEPEKEADTEPNQEEDPQAWNSWNIRQLKKKNKELEETVTEIKNTEKSKATRNQAEQEMRGYEDVVRQQTPDYDAAKSFYVNALAFSIRALNPKITGEALAERVTHQMLKRAGELLNEGYENPVQAMYEEAKSYGYTPATEKQEEVTPLKPDLNKVAANRARNAGTAGAGGRGQGGDLTPRAAAEMTNAEFAKLSAGEKQRIFQQAAGAR